MEGEPGNKARRMEGERVNSDLLEGPDSSGGDSDGEGDTSVGGNPEWLREAMERLEERGQGGLWEDEGERKRIWGEIRVKREREWDVMGWEEWTLEMEEAAPNRTEGENAMEGNVVEDVSDGGSDVQRGEVSRGRGRPRGRPRGMSRRGKGRLGDGETSVVRSHNGVQPTERRPLRGRRRGPQKGLGEGDRERMASLLRNWIGSSTPRTTEDSN